MTLEQVLADLPTLDKPELFDAERFPRLKRVGHDPSRGRIELLAVNETSDGFLIADAIIGEGDNAYRHSVFLGYASIFKEDGHGN